MPRQPGYAVEVCVLARELRQAVLAHRRDDQRVAGEQLKLLGNVCSVQ